jgi:hypothetical protein
MRNAMFGASAAGIWSRVKIEKHTRYIFLRPNVSDSGARIKGPIPSMTTKPVVVPITAVVLHLRSSAICAMPGVNMEDTRGLRTATDVSKNMYRRRECIYWT